MAAQTFIVTGATGGIGSALCHTLHARGAQLVLCGRDADKLRALSEACGNAPTSSLNATEAADYGRAVELAQKKFGGIDGFAHCVGSLLLKPAHLTSDAQWAETMALNLTSAFYAVRAAAPAFDAERGGSIVLVTSAAARHGMPNQEAIAAAKAGVIGLTQAAAATWAPHVRVNAVAPGLIKTPLTRALTSNRATAQASAAMHPLGRFGEPDDVAETIAYLLDRQHAFITGQVWGVDGGLATAHPKPNAHVARPE